MKLASLKSGRDGRLVVVSRDLTRYADASHIAPTLQAALDNWKRHAPRLLTLAEEVEIGSAYVNHVALVRKARNAEMPDSFWTDPLMYQGGSDGFLGPRDPIPLADESWGCDMEGEVAVITGDVRMGADHEEAQRAIRLIMLCNDVSLRNLIPGELAKGFGFFQSKPASAFSPVAVTPDELDNMWDGDRLDGTLTVRLNGEPFGKANTRVDMTFDFPALVAHAAKTRALSAGSIIGSGTVSNRAADGSPGKPVSEGGVGYSCIAELRMVETIIQGAPKTAFLKHGDRVEIEMLDDRGRSIFGRIEQVVGA